MFRAHPIVSTIGLLILALIGSIYLATRDGVFAFGNVAIDLSMVSHALSGDGAPAMAESDLRGRLKLPERFTIATWANGIDNARLLRVTPSGDLLVTQPRLGRVTLIEHDRDRDGSPDGVRVLLEGYDRPHGIDFHDGHLYIAEGTAIARVPFEPGTRTLGGPPERIITGLPDGGNHWTRTVKVGPDGMLYVSIGSSCNVCEEADPRRAAMVRYRLDGSGEEILATGLRNTVDFAWHPATGVLYGTDNGRDLLGDDFPPCEINAIEEGGFYGWPHVNGSGVRDPDYGDREPEKIVAARDPAHELPAHSAPLGIAFAPAEGLPEAYRGAAFVALHGSWNRSRKQGYDVRVVYLNETPTREEVFLSGFEIDEKVYGRPVGLAFGRSGELYVSDDYTGSIYRIDYGDERMKGAAAIVPEAPRRHPLEGLSDAERLSAKARGAQLWEVTECASCHVHGEAGSVPRKLSNLARRYDLDRLDLFLQAPQPPMPRYPFTAEERRALSIYLFERFGGDLEDPPERGGARI